ncbi:MAG: urease accessory protein UreD [Rubrivivax sp.]|nr:urease accessory protein UreD [Rubrivivax sp.]
MGWEAELRLAWRREDERTVSTFAHRGPLRVLKALYPEGPAVCHHVIVHPPGGIVGGDRLVIDGDVGEGAHAVVSTPGATRWYRSDGAEASQRTVMRVGAGARLEWLPAETLVHDGARAGGGLRFDLGPQAQLIGWDLLALGLPASGERFEHGRYDQHLEVPGLWLERGRLDAADRLLLDSPVGLGGRRALATMWWACGEGTADAEALGEAAVEAARRCIAAGTVDAAATALQPRLVVVRALADRIEPLALLTREVRGAWRQALWQMEPAPLRMWAT